MTEVEMLSRLIRVAEAMARRPLDASVQLEDFVALLPAIRAFLDFDDDTGVEALVLAGALGLLSCRSNTQLQTQRLLIVIGQAIELVRDRLEIAARPITLAVSA